MFWQSLLSLVRFSYGGRVPVGNVTVWPGKVRSGKAVKFSSGELGRGLVRHGLFRRSRYGLICRGFGVASRSSQGEARYHMEGCGEIWRSRYGTAWSG